MILDSANKSLELLLGAAATTNSMPVVVDYVDMTTTTTLSGSSDTQSNGTTAVTILAAPAASTQRKVNSISVFNEDTVAKVVTIRLNNNTTLRNLISVTLQVGDTLGYTDTSGWYAEDSSGQRKMSMPNYLPLAGGILTGDLYLSAGQFGVGTTSPYSVANSKYIEVLGVNQAGLVLNNTTAVTGHKYILYSNSDGSFGCYDLTASGSTQSYVPGSGAAGGHVFYVNSVAELFVSASAVSVIAPVGLGYGTGSGGTVSQATSRTTGVTLNKPTGQITMFAAAGSATPASFTVTNSLVGANDVPTICVKSGATNTYIFMITAVSAGSFVVTFWTTGGTASDTPVLQFNLGKGAIA